MSLGTFHLRIPQSKRECRNNASFVIRPGEKVGFIGESGEGKSMVTHLIEMFYAPSEGNVLIDDVNVKERFSDDETVWGMFSKKRAV